MYQKYAIFINTEKKIFPYPTKGMEIKVENDYSYPWPDPFFCNNKQYFHFLTLITNIYMLSSIFSLLNNYHWYHVYV